MHHTWQLAGFLREKHKVDFCVERGIFKALCLTNTSHLRMSLLKPRLSPALSLRKASLFRETVWGRLVETQSKLSLAEAVSHEGSVCCAVKCGMTELTFSR